MTEKFTLEQIHDFWTQQALKHGQSPAASWSDRSVIDMEIREILDHLRDGDRVLDIGCANGYSTMQFASNRTLSIRGIDYIPEMIGQAKQRLLSIRGQLLGEVEFDVGNILALNESDASYDKVVVIRVVINLGDWESQQRALLECSRVLRPGGLLLLSEATLQGWRRLNAFRREWGLPDIPMPRFNSYLDQDLVIQAAPNLEFIQIVNFASTYYVGTRVLKPLLAKAIDGEIEVANPDMEWNRFWSMMPAVGDYGTQKLFIFRRK